MTKLEINIRENNGATKESAPYIGQAISKGSKNFIALTEEAAALCGLPAIQVEAILRGAFAEFAALEKDGAVRINFDGGSVSQVIRGTFISSDAAFDEKRNSLELAWHLSEDVRHHLVNETPRIVSELTSTKVRLDTVADEETPRPYNVIHGRKMFKCTGINLVMSDAGAGIYLVDGKGARHKCVVVEALSRQEVTAQCLDELEGGDYKCVVESRGDDEGGILQSSMRKVKYLKVESFPLGIALCHGEGLANGVIAPKTKPTVLTSWGLKEGFNYVSLAYMSDEGVEVEDTVSSDALSTHSDGEIVIPPEAWSKLPEAGGDVTFTVHSSKGSVKTTAKVAESE